jgi:hypothetical protein
MAGVFAQALRRIAPELPPARARRIARCLIELVEMQCAYLEPILGDAPQTGVRTGGAGAAGHGRQRCRNAVSERQTQVPDSNEMAEVVVTRDQVDVVVDAVSRGADARR